MQRILKIFCFVTAGMSLVMLAYGCMKLARAQHASHPPGIQAARGDDGQADYGVDPDLQAFALTVITASGWTFLLSASVGAYLIWRGRRMVDRRSADEGEPVAVNGPAASKVEDPQTSRRLFQEMPDVPVENPGAVDGAGRTIGPASPGSRPAMNAGETADP